MIEIGRLCMKIAGRDAGKTCVIIDVLDNNFVMIDGETRRRKCNFNHLEPLKTTIKLAKGADHETVTKELEKLGYTTLSTKPKAKTQRPKKTRKQKVVEDKVPKKAAKPAKVEPKAKAPKTEEVKEAKPVAEAPKEVKN